ncbi:hypothetical protein SH2C18_35810 [Clostridium sediminicola]|uniref:sugar phosphate isomerase/epimerase family protein n=1 Tax=Clostridium sediminicola TaxID=3114879 RepID=UPI0031F23736
MSRLKSIVLPAFFPSSKNSADGFIGALKIIKGYDIDLIEFYYGGDNKQIVKEEIEKNNLQSIYLGAIATKTQKLNLSSLDESLRRKSVEVIKNCIDDAYYYNSTSLLINSGPRPDSKENLSLALNSFNKSIEEVLQYTNEIAKDYLLDITLETGDIDVDYCELIGNTDYSIDVVKNIRKKYKNLYITMDTSHLKQLNESPIESIIKAKEFCSHIHLANCVLKDKMSKLYGDKHPEFGILNGEYSLEDIEKIYNQINEIYKENKLVIGAEIICWDGEEVSLFQNTVENMKWFYNEK